jgi:hypothetical protein
MIQVVGRNADGSLGVILGLTAENIQRLVNAQPIVVALPELGLGEGTLIITYGATHDDITASLHPRRACWTCNGSGRHSGLLYGYANRACTSCAGSGRKLRLGARIFRFDMNSPR